MPCPVPEGDNLRTTLACTVTQLRSNSPTLVAQLSTRTSVSVSASGSRVSSAWSASSSGELAAPSVTPSTRVRQAEARASGRSIFLPPLAMSNEATGMVPFHWVQPPTRIPSSAVAAIRAPRCRSGRGRPAPAGCDAVSGA